MFNNGSGSRTHGSYAETEIVKDLLLDIYTVIATLVIT